MGSLVFVKISSLINSGMYLYLQVRDCREYFKIHAYCTMNEKFSMLNGREAECSIENFKFIVQ